jgi:hypothetical protein
MDDVKMLGLSLAECCELAELVRRTPPLLENHNAHRVPHALRMHKVELAGQIASHPLHPDGRDIDAISALCALYRTCVGALGVYEQQAAARSKRETEEPGVNAGAGLDGTGDAAKGG